jgi:hypothetical protein
MSQARHPTSLSIPQPQETFGNFDLIKRVKLGFSDITVSDWRSRVTGLKVVHLDYEGKRLASAARSSYVPRVYSANSPYRERLLCSGY